MTITLIEDDAAVLDSLRTLLELRGMAVQCFTSVEAFLASERDHERKSACIVSDVRLPGRSGLDLQRALKESGSQIPVILITGHGDIPMAVAAMRDGAYDFLEKPYDADRLIASIQNALTAQQRLGSREEEKRLLMERMAELSPRQKEVMLLVAEGLSNKQIAAQLRISPRTVENYRAWVMERLGASNIADLVRKVFVTQDR